jgi:flagellar motor switch/type III secretory pathway protein FliN
MMKPYRLINAVELQEIKLHFVTTLVQWNEEYSITPLNVLSLTAAPKTYSVPDALVIDVDGTPITLIENDYLGAMNQALFDDNQLCFNSTSEKIFFILLARLLKTEQCVRSKTPKPSLDWFYPGSTSLVLTLVCNTHRFILTLSPKWVYQQLPKRTPVTTNLHSLDEALAEHRVTLNLELAPSTLTVHNLANIQVGDVFSSDHLVTAPFRLTKGNQLVAEAELGQSSHHKSILLKRSS